MSCLNAFDAGAQEVVQESRYGIWSMQHEWVPIRALLWSTSLDDRMT
jgi:hypothetical protein